MITNTKTRRVSPVGEVISSWRQRLHLVAAMVLMLVGMLVPQGAWADGSGLETAFIGDKSYYVLRSAEDWEKFAQLVEDAEGKSEVNAILDDNFSVSKPVGMDAYPYNGTFNGNGHELSIDIRWGSNNYAALFPCVGEVTIKNLKVYGKVEGGPHSAGLIGLAYGSTQSITIENVVSAVGVTSNNSYIGGIVGHSNNAKVKMTDVKSIGWLTAKGYDSYAGTIIGWASSWDKWTFHRVYEDCNFTSVTHQGFCYHSGDTAWGYNDKSTNCISSHKWGEMRDGCAEIGDLVAKDRFNQEESGSWTDYGHPAMDVWPAAGDVTFQTYDMVLGTEEEEEGVLKIPFSCDQAVKSIEGYYNNGGAGNIQIDLIEFKTPTYAGFINVKSNEIRKWMNLRVRLQVGSLEIKRTEDQDVTLHYPSFLSADREREIKSLSDRGAINVSWIVNNPKHKDVVPGDQFIVMRSLTGNREDLQSIGVVQYEDTVNFYSFKDSTLISALSNEQLKRGSVSPLYLVVRGAARELWGIGERNPNAHTTTLDLRNIHLLEVDNNYTTKWEDEAAHTVRVTWDYVDEDGAVWDSRAQMKLRIKMVNRDGFAVDTITHVLTAEEMEARTKVVQLPRSCVYYNIDFVVEFDGTTSVYMSPKQLAAEASSKNVAIRSTTEWNQFAEMVKAAKGQYDINVRLMADISIAEQVGDASAPYRGTFLGNGHRLTCNINSTQQHTGPFRFVSNATIRGLRTVGNVSSTQKYQGGLIGSIVSGSTVNVESCHSSVKLINNVNDDSCVGGFVGAAMNINELIITDCVFDGIFDGAGNKRNGGFVAWADNFKNVKLENCLFAPKAINTGMDDCNTWVRHDNSGNVTYKNCHSTKEYAPDLLVINSDADWSYFCKKTSDALGNSDVNAILNADITITEMVENYRGVFDGNGHTINVDITSSPRRDYNAPFRSGKGYTIKNLHVTGTVEGGRFISGLVGNSYNLDGRQNVISNCWVSTTVKSNDSDLPIVGGIIGWAQTKDNVSVTNCRFDGTLTGVTGGAIIGYCPNGINAIEVRNCLEEGAYNTRRGNGMVTRDIGTEYNNNGSNLTNNWSYQDWSAANSNVVGSLSSEELVPRLGSNWQVVGGKAVPVLTTQSIQDIDIDLASGDVDGMSADEIIVLLLQRGWTKDADGNPTPRTVSLGPDVPVGDYYFESLGHVLENSLRSETLQSSVLLSWDKTEEPVDYFEVMRRNTTTGANWETIASQISTSEYEDQTVSPVFDYEYRVQSVNDCEGLHTTQTNIVTGHCIKTGKVEGYVRFADGTGVAGVRVTASQYGDGSDPTKGGSCVTDESGFYVIEKLPYWGNQQGAYQLTVSEVSDDDLAEECKGGLYVTFDAQSNYQKGRTFTVTSGVRFTGLVMYKGTSIPVQGVRFEVDGREVHTASGAVKTNFEGKFDFRILRGQHKVKAVKKNHDFTDKGFYIENNDSTVDFQTDKDGYYFYDETRIKLIGRVVGGKDQGEKPLGYALSNNNLGDSLKMVITLEGDNASRLVWDVQDRTKKTRDEIFTHAKAKDPKFTCQTRVHTTLNRMEIYPDENTGEYEVLLPPVKWKIQQITAEGYSSLFQDGQMGDVLDLSDSLTLHHDTIKGKWKTSGYGLEVTNPVEEYHAKYSRIYHSPVIIDYKQQGFADFDYFGDRYYGYQNLSGAKEQLSVVYGVRKQNWPENKRDSLEAHYTFGYPVFSTDKQYPLKISATERYYYNNDHNSDRKEVVRLSGGTVTIHNGMIDALHRDTLALDSVGEATYVLRAAQTPYLLTGEKALHTMTMTLLMDGTHYEATPLRAYIFKVSQQTGAKDILSCSAPVLVDILRDPPGGASKATLSKGSTLKYSYTMDLKWAAGMTINLGVGTGVNSFTGVVAAPMGGGAVGGFNNSTESYFGVDIDLIWSGSGQRAFSYTMSAKEDISTSTDAKLISADGDLYMGVVHNMVVAPATAIRAIPDSIFRRMAGAVEAGRMVEIAQGRDKNDSLLHLVREEVVTYKPEITSTFVHSQDYIIRQLLPELTEHIRSLMFIGSVEEAQMKADADKKPVYRSKVDVDSPDFGTEYEMISPKDASANTVDEVKGYIESMQKWMEMIGQNEKEKLDATELVKNFDVDGGSSLSYSETFQSDYSVMNSFISPITTANTPYFDKEGSDTFFAIVSIAGPVVGKILQNLAKGKEGNKSSSTSSDEKKNEVNVKTIGFDFKFSVTPVISYDVTPKDTKTKTYSRTESFTISMNKRSHLNFDVLRVKTKTDNPSESGLSELDVFYNKNYNDLVDYNYDHMEKNRKNFSYSRSFVYRTRGGATCRPWESERKSLFNRPGTILDERTKKIENPVITMDKQSVSGVPFDKAARFKLYLTNESEQPEAVYNYFDLYQVDKKNPNGARLMIDGMPLTGNGRTIEVRPGQVTEKILEVYPGEGYDYEGLQIGLISQGDLNVFSEVSFDVHYLQTPGDIAISSPGDKWVLNTDAPSDSKQGWYLPVVISGFDKNQHNFDHIEFQYKETNRGDDYWTNLCGYYADSTLYAAATGTKAMIPTNGNISTKFYGEGTVMEKAYDLRARLFCRNGNAFLTNDSKVLSGVKDTRRPQLFGQPDPKDGIIGAGDNIVFNFTEAIEHNYLQLATNFEVVGETNETALTEEPALFFEGNGYVQTDARRNFANKNMTIDLMIRPDQTDKDMPLFSHGQDGSTLQLWLTKDLKLRAVIDSIQFESRYAIASGALKQVALVLDNDGKQALLWNDSIIGTQKDVTYSGYGPLIFGATNEVATSDRKHYSGRMLEARLWNRTMSASLLNTYGKRQLTGYEMGLIDYYPMNDGEGDYAVDKAQGANAELHGAAWALPRGMSLKLDWAEQKAVKGLKLDYTKMLRSAEQDYTLMLWFKTDNKGQGALISNGKGAITDDDARNKFFLGFEYDQLIYRTNGRTLPLGKGLADDQWHHFAITVDRSHQVANLYVDRVLTQSVSTDTLGGMMGNDFYVGNMVWHEAGANVQTLHQENALAGHIDELCLFSQALPPALLKHYSSKCPTGREKGLLVRMGFGQYERQANNNLELRPYALNQVVKLDMDGNPTDQHDSLFVEPVADIMAHIDQQVGAPIQFSQELHNLKFSFVGRNNQLLVNINELDARINKRNLYVTLTDIPDMNGNYMASPATMEFFVDRNPLRWQVKRLTHEFTHNSYSDQDDIFTVSISNTSGANHTYTIDNMPRWMTVNQPTDIIGPKADQMLIFTISKDLNVGTYDEVIYLTDENGLSEPLSLTIRKEGVKPDWYVADNLKHFSMNLVGQVKIGNAVVTDTKDVVAAFDGMNRCLGVANVSYNAATAKSQLFMTLFNDEANSGNVELTFKLWHHQTGQIMVLEPDRTVTFNHSTVVGTVDAPVVMTGGSIYYQELNLQPGWNWISLNVDNNEYRNVIGMLNKFKWEDGDIVTDDTEDFTLVYKSSMGTWLANNSQKSSYTVSPKRSYRVYVKNRVNVEIKGYPLRDESQRTLRVKHGWNNIGYTPMVNLPVSTALADYTGAARNGDVVKSREAFAIFTETSVGGGYWSGSLQYLKPGEGYMLYRNGDEDAQFRYPFYEPGSNFFERTAQNRAPMCYGRNMSVVATVEGIDVQEGDRLLAFADGELRGEATVLDGTVAETSGPLFYLTIAGDKKVPLSFAIERDGTLVAATAEVMRYENNAVSGTLSEPTAIHFVKTDVGADSWYTLQGYKLGRKPTQKGVYIHNGKKQIVK